MIKTNSRLGSRGKGAFKKACPGGAPTPKGGRPRPHRRSSLGTGAPGRRCFGSEIKLLRIRLCRGRKVASSLSKRYVLVK